MIRLFALMFVAVALLGVGAARATDDESSVPAGHEQSDEAPWIHALNDAFPQVNGAYEIRRFDLLALLTRGRFVDILMSVDPDLRRASEELEGQPYGLEKKRSAVGKNHPGMKFLQKFKGALSGADLALPRSNEEDRELEYTKGTFVLWPRGDDSNLSADMLALGIVLEDDNPRDPEPGIALTIGSWRRFKCWYEPADRAGEVYHRCGVSSVDTQNRPLIDTSKPALRVGVPRR